ncbi:retrovirus-related pol polyprotein from transposon TNT 1-94 [Tanacetum coccineum]
MEILVKTCLMPLALKTQNDSFAFVHELKQEMHADLKYVESLEDELDELDELESDKAEFTHMYEMLLQECVSKDVMCSYLLSSSDLDEITELQCLYLHKVRECDCLAQKLSEQTEFVKYQEQLKNDTICKEKASNVFRKEREQYFKIQYLKAQLQDKNIAISELKKLIEKCKGKSVDTKFDKPSVVRQPNAQRIPKPSVLGKLAPFSDSLERKYFAKKKSVLKTNESEGVTHKTNVSRPQPRSNQMKDKVVPNTSHVKFKKTEVEEHPRISSISNQTKSENINPNKCPSAYTWVPKTKRKWVPKVRNESVTKETGNLSLLCNFVEKYLGTVRFGNDQFALILGYRDLVQGNITIKRVYYVEGLNHNIFLVGQFCDADLEVAFRKSTCFVRDLQGNDLLTGNRETDLYTISLQEITSSTPICLMAKASPTQAWLWHRRLSHLNFDYINLLSKKDVSKTVPSSKGRLNLLHMDLCGPMRVASINGKKYILVIVDDYSRYTWTLFLRSKDETLEVLKDFLTMIQRNLQSLVISVRTDRGTEFLNKTLNAFFNQEGIEHQTSTPRIPEQNGIVKRRNHTLVEAARTMLSASKLPLFFWAKAISTACYTQNRSIIILTHEKTTYHIINDRKPSIKHLYIFGCTCYQTRDGENLDKMKEKGDPCILVGYSTQSKGYCVYNKRTRLIVESIHLRFDEIKEMYETSVANDTSGLVPQ